jgi:hypothetical protein
MTTPSLPFPFTELSNAGIVLLWRHCKDLKGVGRGRQMHDWVCRYTDTAPARIARTTMTSRLDRIVSMTRQLQKRADQNPLREYSSLLFDMADVNLRTTHKRTAQDAFDHTITKPTVTSQVQANSRERQKTRRMTHTIVKLRKKLHDRKPRMTSLGTHYTEHGDGKSSQCIV